MKFYPKIARQKGVSAAAYPPPVPSSPSFLLLCADAAEVKKEANYIVRKKIHCLPYVYVQCVFFRLS